MFGPAKADAMGTWDAGQGAEPVREGAMVADDGDPTASPFDSPSGVAARPDPSRGRPDDSLGSRKADVVSAFPAGPIDAL